MRKQKPVPQSSATIPMSQAELALVTDDDDRDDGETSEAPADSIVRPIAPRSARRASPLREPRWVEPRRSAGESLARLMYFLSGAALAAVVAVYGGEIWQKARHVPEPAAAAAPTRSAAAVAIAASGRIE